MSRAKHKRNRWSTQRRLSTDMLDSDAREQLSDLIVEENKGKTRFGKFIHKMRIRNEILKLYPSYDFSRKPTASTNRSPRPYHEKKSVTIVLAVMIGIIIAMMAWHMVDIESHSSSNMHSVDTSITDQIKEDYGISDIAINCKNNIYVPGGWCPAVWVDQKGVKSNGRVSFPEDNDRDHTVLMTKNADGIWVTYKKPAIGK